LKTETLYSRFGYEYDKDNDLLTYAQNVSRTAQSDYSSLRLTYPEIDFFLSIHSEDEDKRFVFLRKAFDRKQKPYYVSYKERPISKHLWATIQGCL
jgi:hypothetical protein